MPHGSALILVCELMAADLYSAIEAINRPLTPSEVKSVFSGALRGLAHVHGRGIIHRDLKPGNLLLSVGGETVIGDFGLARVMEEDGR